MPEQLASISGDAPAVAAGPAGFRSVLVCLDRSPAAEAVLPLATYLAKINDASLILFHVLETPPETVEVRATDALEWEIARQEARAYLETIAERVVESGVRLESRVAEGHAGRGVAAMTAELDADLVVVSRFGEGGITSLLSPLERTRTPADVQRYRVEPYVLAGDIYARPPWVGRGGWTWYTGSAAWTWRLIVEEILGLRWRRGALEVDPCIPRRWDGFEALVRAHGLTVHVIVRDPAHAGRGIAAVSLDGRPVDRARVELAGTGERLLEIRLGTLGSGEVAER